MSKEESKIDKTNDIKKDNIEKEEPKRKSLFDSFRIFKKGKSKLKIFLVVFSIIMLLILSFAIIVCVNKFNTNVYKNITVLGIDVSGKNTNELVEILEKRQEEIDKFNLDVYQQSDSILRCTPSEINFKIDKAKTIEKILSIGRNGNIFTNTFNIIKILFKGKEAEAVFEYDEEKLDNIIKNIDLSLKNRFVEDSYSIDEEKKVIIIKKGSAGNSIDYSIEKAKIIDYFSTLKDTMMILDVKSNISQELDVNKIYGEIKREAQDAYIDDTKKPAKFVSEVLGIDLDLEEFKNTLEKAENKLDNAIIEFPLIITEPKVKSSDITYDYYNDKLSGKTTYFDVSQKARCNNMEIALSYLNDKVIMPGQIFSYNEAIGDTTTAKGYEPAATFKGSSIVDEIGRWNLSNLINTLSSSIICKFRNSRTLSTWATSCLCSAKFRCNCVLANT